MGVMTSLQDDCMPIGVFKHHHFGKLHFEKAYKQALYKLSLSLGCLTFAAIFDNLKLDVRATLGAGHLPAQRSCHRRYAFKC